MATKKKTPTVVKLSVLLVAWCGLWALGGTMVFPLRVSRPVLLEKLDLPLTIPEILYEGGGNAPLCIVEVGNFECRHSAGIQEAIKDIRRAYSSRVRYAFVPTIRAGAGHKDVYVKAYLAAMRQGRGSEFKEEMFARNVRGGGRDPGAGMDDAIAAVFLAADKAGLDIERFEQDLYSAAVSTAAKEAVAGVRAAGLEATPTLYINGYGLQSARARGAYAAALDTLLARSGGRKDGP